MVRDPWTTHARSIKQTFHHGKTASTDLMNNCVFTQEHAHVLPHVGVIRGRRCGNAWLKARFRSMPPDVRSNGRPLTPRVQLVDMFEPQNDPWKLKPFYLYPDSGFENSREYTGSGCQHKQHAYIYNSHRNIDREITAVLMALINWSTKTTYLHWWQGRT